MQESAELTAYPAPPGRKICDILFKDIVCSGSCGNPSHMEGYDDTRGVEAVRLENVRINGRALDLQEDVIAGTHVSGISVNLTETKH